MQANTTTTKDARTMPQPVRFKLGRLFVTRGAAEVLRESSQSPLEFFNRHARLERGELSDDDHPENVFSVSRQLRIFSAFKTAQGVKLWVITESDRSATTILLPSEY